MERALAERFKVTRLMDAYGRLLTTRQQRLLRLYYLDDLSLSEIAEQLAVTRQAVYDSLHRSVLELQWLEDTLRLLGAGVKSARRRRQVADRLDALETAVGRLNGRVERKILVRILEELAAVRRAVLQA